MARPHDLVETAFYTDERPLGAGPLRESCGPGAASSRAALMPLSPTGRRSRARLVRFIHHLLGALAALALTASGLPARAAMWDHAHEDATNSGFASVATLPALRPLATVPGIGSYAPGAGPVIGPDGIVYLGSREGDLRALRADGSLYWKRSLGLGQAILASSVVDTDGSIYVVGVRSYTDHRVTPAVRRSESRLYHFYPGGGLQWVILFPRHYASVPASADNGETTAPPNIWRSGGNTAIMVPAVYRGRVSRDVRLLAFSPGGILLADRGVGSIVPQVFAEGPPHVSFCHGVSTTTPPDRLPAGTPIPMPGVAIFTFPGGGTPWIVATDQVGTTVGWTFSIAGGFTEWSRKSRGGIVTTSPPMVLPDAHSVVGIQEQKFRVGCGFYDTGGYVTFGGPNGIPLSDVYLGLDTGVVAAPARTADSRIIVAHSYGFDVLRGSDKLQSVKYPGQTIAAAAVSQTHIYISTAGSMRSYDVNTLAKVGEVAWFGGGQSSPAIGPSGRVYALASNVLFIWPGPTCPRWGCVPTPPGGVVNARP